MTRKRQKRAAVLLAGSMFVFEGACLPEDYFAMVGRATSVSFANNLIEFALTQLAHNLGLPGGALDPDGPSDETTEE